MAASSKDIRAGGAWVELYAKDGVSGVLNRVADKVKNFGTKLASFGALGMGGSLIGTFLAGKNQASEIANLADELQLPIEGLSRIKMTADLAGVSMEELAKHPWKYGDAFSRAAGMGAEEARAAQAATRGWATAIDRLQNAMLPLLQVVSPVVELMAKWATMNPGLIKGFVGIAGAVMALGLAFKFVGSAVGVVGMLAKLHPALKLGAGIAAAVGIGAAAKEFGEGDIAGGLKKFMDDVMKMVGGGLATGGKQNQPLRDTAEAVKGMFGASGFTQQLGYGDTINPLRALVMNTAPIPDMAKAVGELGRLK